MPPTELPQSGPLSSNDLLRWLQQVQADSSLPTLACRLAVLFTADFACDGQIQITAVDLGVAAAVSTKSVRRTAPALCRNGHLEAIPTPGGAITYRPRFLTEADQPALAQRDHKKRRKVAA